MRRLRGESFRQRPAHHSDGERSCGGDRQADVAGAALASFALDLKPPAEVEDEPVHKNQSEPEILLHAQIPLEALDCGNLLKLEFGHPAPGVRHGEMNLGAVRPGPDIDRCSLSGIAEGVVDQLPGHRAEVRQVRSQAPTGKFANDVGCAMMLRSGCVDPGIQPSITVSASSHALGRA